MVYLFRVTGRNPIIKLRNYTGKQQFTFKCTVTFINNSNVKYENDYTMPVCARTHNISLYTHTHTHTHHITTYAVIGIVRQRASFDGRWKLYRKKFRIINPAVLNNAGCFRFNPAENYFRLLKTARVIKHRISVVSKLSFRPAAATNGQPRRTSTGIGQMAGETTIGIGGKLFERTSISRQNIAHYAGTFANRTHGF